MNTIEFIKTIVEYINDHPNRDAMLSDMRMVYTNEFCRALDSLRDDVVIDLNNTNTVYYTEEEVRDLGYIREEDIFDYCDIEDLIKEINNNHSKFTVVERELLAKLVEREEKIHDACHSTKLTKDERDLINALKDDGII